jgi:membrane protein implicated in regulation of membrane protease activity
MADILSWAATATTILAALMTASNLGSRVTGHGFAVFTIGALCWLIVGAMTHQPALLWTNVVLLAVDAFGVWRWLGRQARVEEGARAAAQASEASSGETLFPVSLLTRAPVVAGDVEVGRCVDAMGGCTSGRVSYVVVSEGGVAAVGETLRRLPWSSARVEEERVVASLRPSDFEVLEELARDQWPAR